MRFGFILWGEGGQWNFIAYETLQRIIKIHTIIFQQKYLSERMDMALKSCLVGEVVGLSMGHSHLKQKYKKTAMSVPCNTNMVKCAKLYKRHHAREFGRFKTRRGTGFKSNSSRVIFTDSQSLQGCRHCQWSPQKQFKRKNGSLPIWISNLNLKFEIHLNLKFESQIRISNSNLKFSAMSFNV